MEPPKRVQPLIGIVGVCASGKTTLLAQLQQLGYSCRHIAQEHSYVQNMWQRLTNPDILVYLDASYAITLVRRNLNWTLQEYAQQVERLAHARANADILVETDDLTPEQVCQEVQKRILALTSRPE